MADNLGMRGLPASPTLIDRPGQAMQNLLVGDLDGMMRSMFTPQTLSVQQRDSFLKEYGLDKGPWTHIFRLMTNPALILTLALSFKFPVPTAGAMFKVKNQVEAMTRRFPAIGKLSSMQGLYRGTAVPEVYGGVVRDIWDFRSRYAGMMSTSLRQFRDRTGRLPTQQEQFMVSAWLDGLHKPLRGWGGKNGMATIGKGASRAVIPGVGTLMPGLEKAMPGPVKQLAGDFRGVLDAMWKETFGDVKHRERILATMRNMEKKGMLDDMTLSMKEFIADPKKLGDYFPHRLLQTEEDFQRLMQAMTSQSSLRGWAVQAQKKSTRWIAPEARKREFVMHPSIEDMRKLGPGVVDFRELGKMEEIVKHKVLAQARSDGGIANQTLQKLEKYTLGQIQENYPKLMTNTEARQFSYALSVARPSPYSLKLLPVVSSYTHTSASMYGWTVKEGGAKLMTELETLKGVAASQRPGAVYAKMRAQMLEDTYIPMALGRGTNKGALKAQAWDQNMYQLAAWVNGPKVRGVLGDKLADTFGKQLTASHGAFSYISLSQRAAGWFYLSTLGMNPASALKNLLQLVLTTGPVLGPRTTLAGINQAMKKSHKYFALRLGPRKLSHDDAIRGAWPAYGKSGIAAAPITDEALNNAFQNAHNIAALPTGKLASTSRKIQTAMMSIFTGSEMTVRLATWEAAIIHAGRSKMPVADAHRFAARIVEETQFLTGPQNTPYWLVDKNPLVRQLAQFPLRMLEFATHTALNLGVTDVDPVTGKGRSFMGRNPGTFARMIAGSILAMELGRALGVDPSDALLGGALPTFQEGRGGAFGGFPVVPPAFQIAGNVGSSMVSGDFTELMRSTPLLVPGGVELFRAMGLVPGVPGGIGRRASQLFQRTYADYDQPAPDGRIAVYSGKGSLKGFYTPWEVVKMGLGVRSGDVAAEQELMTLLVKNRDTIRETRKDYLDARLRNNAAGARSIAERFQLQFGFALPVTEQDMEAMQARRRVSRLEQMVRTMPPGPTRDQYIQLIAATLGADAQALLGIDPMLLGEPKPTREAARGAVQPTRQGANPKGPYRTGPFDAVNPSTVGRQPLPATSRFGF